MQFKTDMDVHTADGEKVGDVQRVVINPRTKETTHIVVEKGFLFPEDRVIPTKWVADTTANDVRLDPKVDLDDLPAFEIEHYIAADELPPEEDSAQYVGSVVGPHTPVMYYGSVGTWGTYPFLYDEADPFYVVETEQNIPEETVAIKAGADVLSNDGQHVGDVERVFTDSETHRATHFLIAKGFLFKETKIVPTYWIATVTDDEIKLSVSVERLESLPNSDDVTGVDRENPVEEASDESFPASDPPNWRGRRGS